MEDDTEVVPPKEGRGLKHRATKSELERLFGVGDDGETIFAVEDFPAGGFELFAELVGEFEVAGLFGVPALLGEGGDVFGDGDGGDGEGEVEAEDMDGDFDEAFEVFGGLLGGGGLGFDLENFAEGAGEVEVVAEDGPGGGEAAPAEVGGVGGAQAGEGVRGFVGVSAVGQGQEVFVEFVEGGVGGLEGVLGEVKGGAVVAGEEGVAESDGGEAHFLDFGEGVNVADGAGHFVVVNEEVGAVEPVADEVVGGLAIMRVLLFRRMRAHGLGDFVFVVGEDEVHAAAVEVNGLAVEDLLDHGAALDVPAGAALAEGGGPEVGAVLGLAGLPEGEVGGVVAVVFVGEVGGTGRVSVLLAEGGGVEPGEAAVVGEGGDFEIDGMVGGLVGVAVVEEALDEGDLGGDVFDGAGLEMRGEEIEGLGVGVEEFGPVGGDVGEGAVFVTGLLEDAVVHIGDVAGVEDFGGAEVELEGAAKDVLEEEGAEVADVGRAVNRRTAAVEAVEAVGRGGEEGLDGAGEGIVKTEGHREEI